MANTAPALSGLVTSLTFGENLVNATPQLLDADVAFTDPDGNFSGGTLRLTGLLAEDRITIRNQGTGAGLIGLSGSTVSYGGTVIGSYTGGSGNAFTVTFNASATSVGIDALIQNLLYANVSDTPTATRNIVLDVFDAGGAHLTVPTAATLVQQTGADNPFDAIIATPGNNAARIHPTLIDYDNDGDRDLVYGSDSGGTFVYRNDGGTFTSVPVGSTPLSAVLLGGGAGLGGEYGHYRGAPVALDIDGDGDFDLVDGGNYGELHVYRNGTNGSPGNFTRLTGAADPFAAINASGAIGNYAAPVFVDLDGDGDLDLVVGSRAGANPNTSGPLQYFRNGTTGAAGAFVEQTGTNNPLDGINVVDQSAPAFIDLDGDGRPDLVVGSFNQPLRVFHNNGNGSFTELTAANNPFDGIDLGLYLAPSVGDVDGDGDLDLIVGNLAGQVAYFLNTAPPPVAGQTIAVTVTAESDGAAPTATNLSQSLGYTEDMTAQLGDIVVTAPGSSITATLTLSNAAAGALTTGTSNAVTATFNSGTGVWTAAGAVADVNALLAAVAFVPTANFASDLTIATSIADDVSKAISGAISGTIVLTATPVDDSPLAVADSQSLAENATVAIAVVANDTDVDGGPKAVASVNGVALSSGQSITLASGAIVTLSSGGTLDYNTNGKFAYLVSAATAASNGASNSTATDSFSYALNGGSSATVTVTVTGVDGTGDQLRGGVGDDTVTGSGVADYFDLSQGGNDSASGGSGNDAFFLGAAFTATDTIDGGIGVDQIGLQGDYSGVNALVLGATTITGVETIALLSGFDYDLTTNNANVAAGQILTISAAQLAAGDAFTFNGAAESDGRFVVYGGLGADTITTGSGNDGIYFGRDGRFDPATDHVDGGAGTDQLALDGSYTVTISGAQVANIETLALLDGSAAAAIYNITLADDWAAAGQTKTVYFASLRAGATIDGSAETNAKFVFFGGTGDDVITGGAGADIFHGGPGADTLTGGAGADVFVYDLVANSLGNSHDTIIGFDPGVDKIDLPFAVTGVDAARTGTLSAATFDAQLASALATLGANHAVQFTATGGDLNGHIFEVIDANGVAGYQAGQDMVIELQSPTAPITTPTPFI